jgi:FtsP/CotA-like multicopper oxidase with cupredoxin domain
LSVLVRFIGLLLGLLALACAGPGGAHANALTVPSLPAIPEVRSVGGVATLTLRAALDRTGRPAFFWEGSEIAPTIRVHPGDAIHLRYENHLPEFCGLGLVSDSNLHFHGLTASPLVHSDDVIATKVEPGKTFDYVVKIERSQPPGLYWYHPHPHGLANWEIGNGMSGAIVVEGIADAVPQVAGLREQVLVLRDIPLDHSVAAAERLATLKTKPAAYVPADPDEVGPKCGVETTGIPTINGLPSATIGLRPGERQLWRILNASSQRHFVIGLTRGRLQVVAQDGVPLSYAPGGGATQSVAQIVIPPAGRAEVVVTGTNEHQYLVSDCFDAGPGGDINPQAILAMTIDDSGTTRMVRVAPPTGLRPSRAYRSIPAPARYRTIHFAEDAKGFYIDKRAYDPATPATIVARAGTVEEWTLVNETDEVHTFHIHQVHFVVADVNGRAQTQRRWLDVVDLPPRRGAGKPSTMKVLLDFRDPVIRGTFLFHCHIVDHEDGGMMAKIRVI